MIKVLNLYAGIGGNRKNWTDVEVTAIEYDHDIAIIYHKFFPEDKLIIDDAHDYLLNHYKEFDFIWSSPPCTTHSHLKKMGVLKGQTKPKFPDMKLYEEIIFLVHFATCPWVVENVSPYYEELVYPTIKIGRHYFWSNFEISDFQEEKAKKITKTRIRDCKYGFDLSPFKVTNRGKLKRTMLRNLINPELGNHILKEAIKE